MSLASWKAEFYPLEAIDCPIERAIEHSLTKWRGLQQEALQKHDLIIAAGREVTDRASMHYITIGAGCCALCVHHYDDENGDTPCARCPLAIARGGPACDEVAPNEFKSPYEFWIKHGDPQPMVSALERAAQMQHEGEMA